MKSKLPASPIGYQRQRDNGGRAVNPATVPMNDAFKAGATAKTDSKPNAQVVRSPLSSTPKNAV